ncbi:hypothetical protein F2Q69_00021753 [Brassica cretica]|uniref:Uncharacterized protein n=1 Tax=Brassica cretica TaxID=69181 RepID=A0A8S9QDV1_BRACR|nr:hypothetical protein F2Q69_00021753 [Brassica cretica]
MKAIAIENQKNIHSVYEVKVWEDPCMPAHPSAPVLHQNMRVIDLINQKSKEWDVRLLEDYVAPADIPFIRSFTISLTHRRNTFC